MKFCRFFFICSLLFLLNKMFLKFGFIVSKKVMYILFVGILSLPYLPVSNKASILTITFNKLTSSSNLWSILTLLSIATR